MALLKKLFEVQGALKDKIVFDAKNPHFRNEYITLNGLLATVLPELHSRGVLLIQPLSSVGTQPAVTTVFHDTEDNETVEWTVPLVLEKDTPQAMGSAITYTRRYSILDALGLCADEDDDAEGATNRPVAKKNPVRNIATSQGDNSGQRVSF